MNSLTGFSIPDFLFRIAVGVYIVFVGSAVAAEEGLTLRQAAERTGRLLIGTNTDYSISSYEPEYGETIAREFNAISTSASMWMRIHPEQNRWDFALMDEVVEFASQNNLTVIANPILWGSQSEPGAEPWNDYDPSYLNDSLTPDEARQIMRDHITTLLSRYRGKIREWVVANEVIDLSSPTGYRQDIFARKLGTVEYLTEAFKLFHELDPHATLILNDGSTHGPGPRAEHFYALTRELLGRGAPVHAVGFQTHWTNFETMPSFEEMKANLARFAALGIEIRFTEVDVMVGHLSPEEREVWQQEIYQGIVSTCLDVAACKGITFWGFTDKHNWWIDEIGYTDEQPLLFDSEYKKKPAYDGVLSAIHQGRS